MRPRQAFCVAALAVICGCSPETEQTPTASIDSSPTGSQAATNPVNAAKGQSSPSGQMLPEVVREQVRTLLDTSAALKSRASAARLLAEDGSAEALAALLQALPTSPEQLKLVIAESLGTCPNPQAAEVLLKLVDDPAPGAQVGAIRALGLRGDPESARSLAQVLLGSDRAEDVRMEAALALSEVREPEAFQALTRAALDPESAVAERALQSLAKRPFEETHAFFEQFLGHADTPRESKIAMLEALGEAKGDPSSLLLGYATSSDDELRSAAAWGLLSVEGGSAMHGPIMNWLKSEQNADVRTRLYNALQQQSDANPTDILNAVRSEADPQVRLAALGAAAAFVEHGAAELPTFFDQTAVPELTSVALQGKSGDRLTAVATLGRAGTPAARTALEQIRATTPDPRVRSMAESALSRERSAAR